MADMDFEDAVYRVYRSPSRSFEMKMESRTLTLSCQDFGPASALVSSDGGREYEFFYSLSAKGTEKFIRLLREEYGGEKELGELLRDVFGVDQGPRLFSEFCEKNRIHTSFFAD